MLWRFPQWCPYFGGSHFGGSHILEDASSHVPDAETSMPSRIVDVNGRWFEALRTTTQQPNLAPALGS